jgi:hypothetical protein
MTRPRSRVRTFGEELRRRRVLRVAIIYAAAGWVAVEASDTIAPLLLLPDWTSTLVLVLLLLGLPLALGLAWSFDITSEGIRRTGSGAKYRSARNCRPEAQQGRRWTTRHLAVIGAVAVLALAVGVAIAVRTVVVPGQRTTTTSVGSASEAMRQSVAVLPFSLLGSQAPTTSPSPTGCTTTCLRGWRRSPRYGSPPAPP